MPSYFKIDSNCFGPPKYCGYDTLSVTDYIRKEFDKIGYGDMWDGIAKERAMEKERYLRLEILHLYKSS